MKKNENIYITLQIQKDQESKALCLLVQFDKNAPNFSLEDEAITWYPTSDELGFIAEAFNLTGGSSNQIKAMRNMQQNDNTTEPPNPSSEIRVATPPDDTVIEVTTDERSSYIKKKPTEDRIFVQADDKTIDEALKRKKGIDEEYGIESSEKTLIDRMLKQKKKKE
jgi:hypothetical protein